MTTAGTHISASGNPSKSRDAGLIEEERRTRLDAMRHIARDVPDPKSYAYRLPPGLAHLLVTAYHSKGVYRVAAADAPLLQPYGLVEAGEKGRHLTAFAIKVRRVIVEEGQ